MFTSSCFLFRLSSASLCCLSISLLLSAAACISVRTISRSRTFPFRLVTSDLRAQ